MELKDIKIGGIYKVVGTTIRSTVCKKPCSDCFTCPVKVIKIIKDWHDNERGMVVDAEKMTPNSEEHCNFHPNDLEPIKINWKTRVTTR